MCRGQYLLREQHHIRQGEEGSSRDGQIGHKVLRGCKELQALKPILRISARALNVKNPPEGGRSTIHRAVVWDRKVNGLAWAIAQGARHQALLPKLRFQSFVFQSFTLDVKVRWAGPAPSASVQWSWRWGTVDIKINARGRCASRSAHGESPLLFFPHVGGSAARNKILRLVRQGIRSNRRGGGCDRRFSMICRRKDPCMRR